MFMACVMVRLLMFVNAILQITEEGIHQEEGIHDERINH